MKSILLIASVLVVGGLILIFLPTPGAPVLECLTTGASSSPLVEPETGCAVTSADALRYQEWDAQPKWDNIGGLAMLLVGIGMGGTALARQRRRRPAVET